MSLFEIYLLLAFLTCFSFAKTPEQLLDSLRERQIQAMVKEQRKFNELKVPEELAKAASLEAKKRVLAAESDIFEINATPYSPFSADKSTKNLGYLGRGYDVLFGNPLDESGRVDPGFRLQAVELGYIQNRFSADGEYRIPDNADVIMEPSALFSSSFNDVRTENDYKQTLKEDVKTTAGFGLDAGFVSVSGEFSQSKSYQSTKESIKKGGKVNIDIVGRATAYKAWLHTVGTPMVATKALQKAIEDLPTQCPKNKPEDLSPYYRLAQTFGTHFTTVVTMGAKAVQRLTMTTAESMDLKRKGISTNQVVSASVGFMAKGVSASAKFGREEGSSSDTTLSNTLKTMNIQKREFYIGGEPPSESYYSEDNQASTASLRQWGRSAFERPVPIQYELQQLIGLFDKKYLPDVTENQIPDKRKCMEDALRTYCSNVAIDKEECIAYEDGAGVQDAIRYGDFISIHKLGSSNKFLGVKNDFPKFVQDTEAQDFKVVPVDVDAYWKYGKALHYQEPFNLVSEYGGQQGIVKCHTSGSNFKYSLFNYGKQRVTCTKEDNPVGVWKKKTDYWCKKSRSEALTFNRLTVGECQRKCLELTNGECKAIQIFNDGEVCAHCDKPEEIVAYGNDRPVGVSLPGYVYQRDAEPNRAEREALTATLYFTSPSTERKPGTLVKKNDKVYIGVSSYEERKQLYDVRRPAFLEVVSDDVKVKEDSGTAVYVSDINCKDGLQDSEIKKPLGCSYWWKIKVAKKTLHTYPRVHFET